MFFDAIGQGQIRQIDVGSADRSVSSSMLPSPRSSRGLPTADYSRARAARTGSSDALGLLESFGGDAPLRDGDEIRLSVDR